MILCNCNPFSDRKVRDHLAGTGGKASVADTYKCCSGGQNPQCCQCIPAIKNMVQAHNAALTISDIKHNLETTREEELA